MAFCCSLFLLQARQVFSSFSFSLPGDIELIDRSADMSKFQYKEQYAVVVICKDEKEQEETYNKLKEQGHNIKVVAV